MKTSLKSILLLLAIVGCSLSAMARVGNQFEFSTEEADMVLTITSESTNEVEISKYTPKNGWPVRLIIPEIAVDEERGLDYTITSIGPFVFGGAHIREVKFPETMRKLGNNAFENAELLGVDLRNIEEIGNECFLFDRYTVNPDGKSATFYPGLLRYVVLGSSIKKMGDFVFRNQNLGLHIVSYSPEPPLLGEFQTDYGHITIQVPIGSMEAYSDAIKEGTWFEKCTVSEFQDDVLLCAGSTYSYYEINDLGPRRCKIGQGIPCIATWTLCEVNNEFGPQPEPSIKWSTSNDKSEITEEGVITGFKTGYSNAEGHLSLDQPELTGDVIIRFDFYEPNSGVESVEADESVPARIYDLNGREVTGQQLGHGIYIRVTGSHTEKIAL